MITPAEQLDRRLNIAGPLLGQALKPSQGWIKAIRTALGMTTGQLARRLKVAQTRVSRIEAAEATGHITLNSLNKAAEALGCKVIYVLVPDMPLHDTLQSRARKLAERQLSGVEQTMRLEDQAVESQKFRDRSLDELVRKLLQRPSRLWDDQ